MPSSKSNKEISSNLFQKYNAIRKEHDESNEYIISDSEIVVDKQFIFIQLITKCDIHYNYLYKLLNVFRENPKYCFSRIITNPYQFVILPDNIMSFEKAKDIAERFSLNINKDFIHKAWLYDFILFKNNKFYLEKHYISSKFKETFPSEEIAESLCFEVQFKQKRMLTMPDLYDIEITMGEYLMNNYYSKTTNVSESHIDTYINTYETTKHIRFTKKQRKALFNIFNNKLSIVCGLPGTGKSTIADCVCSYHEDDVICLTAPTGMAVNNIRNKCNVKKSVIGTIHKLLFDGFVEIKEEFPKVMIVDEFSMVDNILFYKLVKWCCHFDCKLVLLADDQQLPPIGGGFPLGAMIESKLFNITFLKTIKRQETGNLRNVILKLSQSVNIVNTDFDKKSVFFYDFSTDNIQKLIKKFKLTPENSVFISPQHKHPEGTVNINNFLQDIYSKNQVPFYSKQYACCKDYIIKENDLVVRTVNNYSEKNLYANGDVARIKKNKEKNCIDVHYIYSNTVQEISINELYEEFCLAYCMSVHKVQGSQFDNIVLIIGDNHSFSWTNNDAKKLLYTAISRAKQKCFILGNPKLFSCAQTLKGSSKHTMFLKLFHTYEIQPT